MPTFQDLILTDRQATPVNHTFKPRAENAGVFVLANAGPTGAAIEDKIFSISHRRVNGRMKSTLKMKIPVVVTETVNGVARAALLREAFVDATFTFAQDSTEAERNNAIGMFASALGTTKVLVNDTLVKGESVY